MALALLEISLRSVNADTYAMGMDFSMPNFERRLPTEPHIVLNFSDGLVSLHEGQAAHGRWLGRQLLAQHDGVLQRFREARSVAAAQGMAMQIRLLFDGSARHLHQLHWEALRLPDTDECWTENANFLFARCLDSDEWTPVNRVESGKLRVLVVIANPTNFEQFSLTSIDVPAELARIRNSLGRIQQLSVQALARPGEANLDNIIDHLREGYDCLYLICHGALSRDRRESVLYLVNDNNEANRVSGTDLARRMKGILAPQRPRLAVLLSCQSSGDGTISIDVPSNSASLTAIGPQLVQDGGVPAVLAMQGDVPMKAGAKFIGGFFRGLQRDELIDQAVAAGRAQEELHLDQWQPVLLLSLSLKDGNLWRASAPEEVTDTDEPLDRSELLDIVTKRFNLSELSTVAYKLGIDFENIAGQTKTDKARELVLWLERRDRLKELNEFL